ncbi:MAG: T9SS type A sorting domain-containing protein [Sphingobacteriales bacterium]|nr:MAG: T9SS type A sorting domain-containing protein [Sphingobacteriales bacterium]
MKHLFLLVFLTSFSLTGRAQAVILDTSYYAPPPVVRQRVLTEDPDHNPNHQSGGNWHVTRKRELLETLNEVQTWYVSAEAGFRSDASVLSNYNISYNTAVFTINGVTIDASASGTPVAQNTSLFLKAKVTPAVAGVTVTFTLDNAAGTTRTATTGTDGIATSTAITGLTVGVYKVSAVAGSGCNSFVAYLPVYDPNSGFVTGGGWVNSLPGSYVSKPTTTGKANFGFVAKYKKGSTVTLEGETEFNFTAGDLNFKSTSYENMTLVISGAKASYRGVGTINGLPQQYKFTLVATDGQVNGGGGYDKVRMKITTLDGLTTIYDNQLGTADNAELGINTVLGGGSVVIHEVKGKTQKIEEAQMVATPQLTMANKLTLKAYPNPAITQFNISLESNNTRDAITLKVYNQLGQVVDVKRNLFSGQVVQVGAAYKQGTYFIEVTQGEQKQTMQVVKSN